MKRKLLYLLLLITFVSCKEEKKEDLFTKDILPSGIWIEKTLVKQAGIWRTAVGFEEAELTFNKDKTGKRTVKPFFQGPTGRPMGIFYGFFGQTNLSTTDIDINNLTFTWEYSSPDKSLTLYFPELNSNVTYEITEISTTRISTKPLEGTLNLNNSLGGIGQTVDGLMTVLEKKQ